MWGTIEKPEPDLAPSCLANIGRYVLDPCIFDYLDKKILDMKTINLDELESYNSEDKKIDDSIYDSAVLDIKQNRIVDGTVINITDKCIFVDIGFKSEGMIPKDEFSEIPDMNESIKVYIKSFEDSKGNFILSKQKADFEIKWNEIREIFDNDGIIKGKIIKRIKGGMVVELGVVQGFLPGSQIEIYSVTDFDKYINMYEHICYMLACLTCLCFCFVDAYYLSL